MSNFSPEKRAIELRVMADRLGFMHCGVSQAESLDDEAKKLENWLSQGYQGQMSYLENHFDLRVDPRKIVPSAKSVISLTFNYFPEAEQQEDAPKVARYAYGRDYHKVIKSKIKELWQEMNSAFGELEGRYFVDSGPVMERVWAERAGLGWRGKNTLLINPKEGSYFFLAVIITDLEITADGSMRDHCGRCRKCIDACPTDAFSQEAYVLDASKCISYLTIELKDEIPTEFEGKMDNWMFGCDICQEVCPWNRFSKTHNEPDFTARGHITEMKTKDWHDMDEFLFSKTLAGTPLIRAGYNGIRRNLKFLNSSVD